MILRLETSPGKMLKECMGPSVRAARCVLVSTSMVRVVTTAMSKIRLVPVMVMMSDAMAWFSPSRLFIGRTHVAMTEA